MGNRLNSSVSYLGRGGHLGRDCRAVVASRLSGTCQQSQIQNAFSSLLSIQERREIKSLHISSIIDSNIGKKSRHLLLLLRRSSSDELSLVVGLYHHTTTAFLTLLCLYLDTTILYLIVLKNIYLRTFDRLMIKMTWREEWAE